MRDVAVQPVWLSDWLLRCGAGWVRRGGGDGGWQTEVCVGLLEVASNVLGEGGVFRACGQDT